ncbi:MAG: TRAM domain-containing protein [Armatimonadetes bacterium]|nr:TRAM domain-containing protein [Armatimonadota bacterium]
MTYCRGDEIEVIITRDGLADGAGIGYLPDDTMVVIVGGAGRVGESIQATIMNMERTPLGYSIVANARA